MIPFVRHRGVAAPLLRDHIDTDVIIPKQYLKSVRRTGFGPNLFDDWRYLAPGGPGDDHAARPRNPEFVLNRPRYAGASILVAGANFGCGSSREHAVWAFLDAGFRAVIAPDFADIFDTNAAKCGLLTVRLEPAEVRALAAEIEAAEGLRLAVDLPAQTVTSDGGRGVRLRHRPAAQAPPARGPGRHRADPGACRGDPRLRGRPPGAGAVAVRPPSGTGRAPGPEPRRRRHRPGDHGRGPTRRWTSSSGAAASRSSARPP